MQDFLYSGLEQQAAGKVIAALDQQGAKYQIKGGSIFVEGTERDQLRMTLAAEGLPDNGAMGYELLDSLSGFSTTSQMFDAAYWRAKEGELARTILANPQISQARVHISSATRVAFQRNNSSKASVYIATPHGELPQSMARALRYLVASAVPGLEPNNVAIIDEATGLIDEDISKNGAQNDQSRATELRARIERLLGAHVGHGNAIVEVSVETNTETASITERRFDPKGRVVVSSETEEKTDAQNGTNSGTVTVASNLPDQTAGGGDSNNSNSSETRETINYEVSETTRETRIEPGSIKRLGVAVLVNFTEGAEGPQPRTEAELNDLRDLVAAAVGFDAARGDEISIKSLAFQPMTQTEGEASVANGIWPPIDLWQMIKLGILALVCLIVSLFVIRPILRGSKVPPLPDPVLLPQANDAPSEQGLILHQGQQPPIDKLRALIGDKQDDSIEILRNWLEEKQEEKT